VQNTGSGATATGSHTRAAEEKPGTLAKIDAHAGQGNDSGSIAVKDQAGQHFFEQYADLASLTKAQPAKEKHPLYGDGDKSICPKAVVQGGVNDCFFFAPLAAVANARPDLIKNAIKQNTDGSFDVTFPKAIDHKPVHVPPLTEQELLDYGHETASGKWPAVMEKAFGIYLRDHPSEREKYVPKKEEPGALRAAWNWLTSDETSNDVQKLADLGKSPPVLALLTGYEPGGRSLGPQQSATEVGKDLSEAFTTERKLPVVAGIAAGNQIALAQGLRPEHDYTVLGYENGVVTLRDPTGQTAKNDSGKAIASKDGVFTMTVQDFTKSFNELVIDQMHDPFAGGGIMMGPNFKNLKLAPGAKDK
jgi:hypothetical protein